MKRVQLTPIEKPKLREHLKFSAAVVLCFWCGVWSTHLWWGLAFSSLCWIVSGYFMYGIAWVDGSTATYDKVISDLDAAQEVSLGPKEDSQRDIRWC